MTPPPFKVSATRLRTWLICPEQFRLDQIHDGKRDRNEPSRRVDAQRGTLVHAALEEVALDIASTTETGTITATAALKKLGEVVGKREGFAAEAAEQAAEILRNMRPRPVGRILGVERKFEVEFSPDAPPLFPTIDLISESVDANGVTIRLIDWKTSARAADKRDAETDAQVVLYLAAAHKLISTGRGDELGIEAGDAIDRLRFELIYPAINRRVFVDWSPELQAYAESLWNTAAPRARNGEGKAKTSHLCNWCAHRWHCPAFAEAGLGELGDQDSLIAGALAEVSDADLMAACEKASGNKKAAERMAKDLGDELERRIVAAKGPIDNGERVAKLVTSRRRILRTKDLVDACDELGLDAWEVITAANPTLQITKIEGVLDEAQQHALKPYVDATVSTRVSFSNSKGKKS